jgi:tetratricopeptide (TPR) repeat protein
LKILRSYTIIPPDLYIERNADRELEAILGDMGRPGYVLVARQMGKTNLLLNARRKHNNDDEVFVYLDASNLFPDVRSFFRGIIDLALETRSDKFSNIANGIQERRSGREVLPHKEHEAELKSLIASGIKKLVICIDEIDALARSEFSDQVFSFIRSVYFSGRSNFEEFERLTYLLSGVAEPADIIKNKDISPFNIGSKIYLDDFSDEEVRRLIIASGLNVSELSARKVIEWTKGYPRMTWDVCSELEGLNIEGFEISPEIVDGVVGKLYFGEVESPPIDHIKRLVEDSQDIRDAIIALHYGKADSITERVRTKLYLAGISKMPPKGHHVDFKNRVLQEALTESFVLSVSKIDSKAQLKNAEMLCADGQYQAALSCLPIESLLIEMDEKARAYGLRAEALYGLRCYEDAAESYKLLIDAGDVLSPKQLLKYGQCISRLGQHKEAANLIERVISADGYSGLEARVELALALEECGDDAASLAICESVLAEQGKIFSAKFELRPSTESFSLICLARSRILARKGDLVKARASIEEALPYASVDLLVRLYLALAGLSNNRRRVYLKQCEAAIRKCEGFSLDEGKAEQVSIEALYDFLAAYQDGFPWGDFEILLDKVLTKDKGDLSLEQILQGLCSFGDQKAASVSLAVTVLERSIKILKDMPARDIRQHLQTLLYLAPDRRKYYFGPYLGTFGPDSVPSMIDIVFLNNIAVDETGAVGDGELGMALSLLNRDPDNILELSERQRMHLQVLRDYLGVYSSLLRNPSDSIIGQAKEMYSRYSASSDFDLPGFGRDHFDKMRMALSALLRRQGVMVGASKGQKVGRNELIEVSYNGRLVQGKYKRLSGDIRLGYCVFIRKIE